MIRPVLRRIVPAPIRLRIALVRRALRDLRLGVRFAVTKVHGGQSGKRFATYRLPVTIFAGQEAWADGKVRNLQLMARAIDGVVLEPGQTFSLWGVADDPTANRGYGIAAGIRNGEIVGDVGGATCLLSTVVFNTALLGGLRVDERHPHSVDTYGEARYFDFGRDASIEYGYRDLRFTNMLDVPVVLHVEATGNGVEAWLEAESHVPEGVLIHVTPPELRSDQDVPLIAVRTTRTRPGGLTDDLGWSLYRAPRLKAVNS